MANMDWGRFGRDAERQRRVHRLTIEGASDLLNGMAATVYAGIYNAVMDCDEGGMIDEFIDAHADEDTPDDRKKWRSVAVQSFTALLLARAARYAGCTTPLQALEATGIVDDTAEDFIHLDESGQGLIGVVIVLAGIAIIALLLASMCGHMGATWNWGWVAQIGRWLSTLL